MNILDDIKIKCIENGINMKMLLERYNAQFDKNIDYAAFYRRFKNNSIRLSEYKEIMSVLGYDVIIQKRKEGE